MNEAAVAPPVLAVPPGPRGLPLFGSLFRMRKDPLAFVLDGARTYGDAVRYQLGPQPVILFTHPDQVKEVLVTRQHDFVKGRGLQWAKRFLGEGLLTSEGDIHRRQRRLSQPAFHKDRIAGYGAVMVEEALAAREHLRPGAVLDVAQQMMRLTLSVVARTLFSQKVDGDAAEIGRSLTTLVQLFYRFTNPFAPILDRLPLPSNFAFERARSHLDGVIYRVIAERRRDGRDHGDLLSTLIHARDEEHDGGQMSDLQLRDELMTLFLAGHETTANALTWTWYLLSENPDAEARMHAELAETLGDRLPSFEDVRLLPVTEAVLAESMRLYPPAPIMGRRALRDTTVGGYDVRENTLVLLSPWATHRDPRFYPEPERFDLSRWSPEARAARPRFAYFPFGGGARQCIGEGFAWTEGILLLAVIAQHLRFRLVPGHPVVPQALITLRPKHGMRMEVIAR